MADVCPNCGSSNVAIGNVVLSCSDCDWSFLNKHPCGICGQPSYSFIRGGGEVHYRCLQHDMTEVETRGVFRRFFELLRNKKRG